MIRTDLVMQMAAIIVSASIPIVAGLLYFERRLAKVEARIGLVLQHMGLEVEQ